MLPDLVRFAYIPASDFQTKESDASSARSVDYSQAILPPPQPLQLQEQILVLDFADNTIVKKANANPQYVISHTPYNVGIFICLLRPAFSSPILSTTAVKNLIEARNERFCRAVEEYIIYRYA